VLGCAHRTHWQKFLSPWKEPGVIPRPHFFEIDFGLPGHEGVAAAPPLVLRHEGVEVRVSGRIDRVDVADLEDGAGFWIIDYKTGRSAHYTGADLREFRKLQLTLYAVAVEEVLLKERGARPLGLAYWLVTDGGPKVALPGRDALEWFREVKRWSAVRQQLESEFQPWWRGFAVRRFRCGRDEGRTDTCRSADPASLQSRLGGEVMAPPLRLTEQQRGRLPS
jgi:hypothetical protein